MATVNIKISGRAEREPLQRRVRRCGFPELRALWIGSPSRVRGSARHVRRGCAPRRRPELPGTVDVFLAPQNARVVPATSGGQELILSATRVQRKHLQERSKEHSPPPSGQISPPPARSPGSPSDLPCPLQEKGVRSASPPCRVFLGAKASPTCEEWLCFSELGF